MQNVKLNELSSLQAQALDLASTVMDDAYSPYSHFCVGACLYTPGRKFFPGANFENASYGMTICAERSAVVSANVSGFRVFAGIAIIGKGEDFDTEDVTAPCGACRQVLYEVSDLSGGDLELVMSDTKMDKIVVASIKEILPLAFGPANLGIDLEKYRHAL